MKKIILSILTIILILILATVSWLLYFPAPQDNWEIQEKYLSFYKESYEENRQAFREECKGATLNVPKTEANAIPLKKSKDSDLTIDTCYIPSSQNKSKSLLIVTAGIHGGEAYASSAIQRMFLRDLVLSRKERPDVLLIHSINAYGMKYFQRVTENNVDLNRNFDTTREMFSIQNPGYAAVMGLLNPEGKADLSSFQNRLFSIRAIIQIISKGMGALRQAILQGQYEYEKGIYFGGKDFEEQVQILDPILKSNSNGKKIVVFIDLHTGYGERGTAHLFPNTPPNQEIRDLTDKLFLGYRIDYPGGDFYSTYGDFSSYVGKIQNPDVKYVPMVFEYGTLDSQTTKGSILSIHNTILENQSRHYGCETELDCKEIKNRFREMFYPSSPSWRSKIMKDSVQLFTDVLDRIEQL